MVHLTKSAVAAALGAGLALGTLACGTTYDYDEPDEFAPSSGQGQRADELPYPAGPFGYGVGRVIPPFEFIGYTHPESELYGPMRRISLAEFYNPTGVEVYGPGGGMPEGAPKPVALLLVVSASWCGPCNQEATVLPSRYTALKPRGAEFMVNLADSLIPGQPATQVNLDSWIENYAVEFPLVLDPTYKLTPVAARFAWPANYIIDTRSMRVAKSVTGVPDTAPPYTFWPTMDQVIEGTFVFPE